MHSIQDHKCEAAYHSMPYRDFTGSIVFLAVLPGENRMQKSSRHGVTSRPESSGQHFHRECDHGTEVIGETTLRNMQMRLLSKESSYIPSYKKTNLLISSTASLDSGRQAFLSNKCLIHHFHGADVTIF